ncbi:MAG: hypothetical protein AAFU57_01580 [Bacteroidota bacterium]
MKRNLLFLFGLLLFTNSKAQNFDTLIDKFKVNLFDLVRIPQDSVTKDTLYKTSDFEVSISKNPITINVDSFIIKNPNYTEDIDDWDDNYINYPKSPTVIFEENLISLFDNGKFICHSLNGYTRNRKLEEKLSSKHFNYHWSIDGELYARARPFLFSQLYKWNGKKWVKTKIKLPFDNEPILFADKDFIIYRKCAGEFGGTIYFYDRKSTQTYYTDSTCSITVAKFNGKYHVYSNLGHMMGRSKMKIIDNPKKLSKADKSQLKSNLYNLGYQDKSRNAVTSFDLMGIQLFSSFSIDNRPMLITHLQDRTFLSEIKGRKIEIINPLFNNNKYTHDPITRTYGKYILINLDFDSTAMNREVSLIVIEGNSITLLDWNENQYF